MAGHPLLAGLVAQKGVSVFTRELARLIRPASLLPAMEIWLGEISENQLLYQPPGEISEGEGWGLTHASRGALGHWLRLEEGRIAHYQIITPTAWNASPRDEQGRRGPLEQALIGTPVPDQDNLVQVGHVVRSFDPCLVCTVHAWKAGHGSQVAGRRIAI
jgi:hydrogenase large subunit